MAPPEKTLLEGRLVYLDKFDPEKGLDLVVVYRDKEKIPWAKKVHIQSFIHDKEYELIKGRAGRIDHLLFKAVGTATCQMILVPRLRVHEETFDLSTLEECGLAARGTRLAERPTQKVVITLPE